MLPVYALFVLLSSLFLPLTRVMGRCFFLETTTLSCSFLLGFLGGTIHFNASSFFFSSLLSIPFRVLLPLLEPGLVLDLDFSVL